MENRNYLKIFALAGIFSLSIPLASHAAYITNGNSQWTTDVNGIYYPGNIGVGAASVISGAKVRIASSTAEGLRIISAEHFSPFVIRNSADTADLFRVDQFGNITGGNAAAWSLNGTSLYPASTTHNVGIGNTNPGAYKLYVTGSTYLNGATTINSYVNSVTGYRVNGTAATGTYLRGNGTNYVSSTIQAGDVPTLNQNTSGYAGILYSEDNRTISPSELTARYLRFGFTSYNNNNAAPWADFLHFRSYQDSSGGSDNLLVLNRYNLGMRLYQQAWGTTTAYASYKDIALSDNSPVVSYLTKYTSTGTTVSIGKSLFYDNGTNIGIGTTSLSARLHFNTLTGDAINAGGGKITNLNSPTNATDAVRKDYVDDNFAPIGLAGNVFGTGTANYLPKWTAAHTLANSQVYENGANVGVGTSSPSAKLHVIGTMKANTLDLSPSGGAFTISASQINRTDGYVEMQYAGGNGVRMFGSTTYPIVFSGTGNVGIGTTNPTSKLYVNGTVALGSGGYYGRIYSWNPGSYFSDTPSAIISGISSATTTATSYPQLIVHNQEGTIGNFAGIGFSAKESNSGGNQVIGAAIMTQFVNKVSGGWNSGDLHFITKNLGVMNDAMVVKYNGNVGIGTTNPIYGTDIVKTGVAAQLRVSSGVGGSNYTGGIRLGAYDSTQTADILFTAAGQNSLTIATNYVSGANAIYLKPGTVTALTALGSGNVGIGTTSPNVRLYINGGTGDVLNAGGGKIANVNNPVNAGDAANKKYVDDNFQVKGNYFLQNGNSFGATAVLGTNDSYGLNLETANAARMSISSSGVVNFNIPEVTSAFAISSASLGGPRFSVDDANSRIFFDGDVGIGVITPAAKLDIDGTIKISGGNPGDGKVLTSDANGLASWVTPAAGGVTSVTSTDGTLTISPNTGAVVASLNLAKANTWTAAQTFNASTTFPGSGIWGSSGNVGIGTTNPGAKLDVIGSVRSSSQLISTVASGTAPLSVSSNTLITNLNADFLDGNHAADFTTRNDVAYLGTVTFNQTGTTTADFITKLEDMGAFDNYHSIMKATWNYAGNADIMDTGFGTLELAGCVVETWTDNADDVTRGNIHVRVTRPTTGGGGGQILVYNDQGSTYSPGWRQIWNSSTDGTGSGLDADLWDGNQFASYLNQAVLTTSAPTFSDLILSGGDLTINNNNGGINFNDSSAYWLKTATSWGIYWDTTNNQIKFNGNGITRSFIDLDDGASYFNGNVGIGITNPSNKLSFSASTTEVKIGLNGGYVRGLTITPIDDTDAVSKGYVDQNFAPKSSSAFIQNGNSFGATATLGTNDNNRLDFETNNATRMTIYNNGNVGIGTTVPSANLMVNRSSMADPSLTFGSAAATIIRSEFGEFAFGMASTSPNRLWIQGRYTGNAARDISINPLGGNVGIGTTAPLTKLHVVGSGSFGDSITSSNAIRALNLVSTDAVMRIIRISDDASTAGPSLELLHRTTADGANTKWWDMAIKSTGLVIRDRTGTAYDRLVIDNNGNVGIGTTSPTALLAVAGAIKATSITATGKVTATTFDPPYTISGRKYATYASGMTGVKEETSGVAKLSLLSKKSNLYYHQLDLFDADRDSDLWLFSKTANLEKEGLADLSVLLTPRFSGRVWYEKNEKAGRVTIYATPDSKDSKLEVSYRLTAPRFDFREHGNTRPDDDNIEGLNLDNLR